MCSQVRSMADTGVPKKERKGRGEHLSRSSTPKSDRNSTQLNITIIMGPIGHHAHASPCCTMQDATSKIYKPSTMVLICQIPAETARSLISRLCRRSSLLAVALPLGASTVDAFTRRRCRSIVVAESSRLEKIHWNADLGKKTLRSNDDRSYDQSQEDNKKHEVEDCIANHSTLSELGLLQ